MAWDLDKLANDSIAARNGATSAEKIVSTFVNGKVQGVDYTGPQKTALKDAFVAQVVAAETALAAVRTQIDAN